MSFVDCSDAAVGCLLSIVRVLVSWSREEVLDVKEDSAWRSASGFKGAWKGSIISDGRGGNDGV